MIALIVLLGISTTVGLMTGFLIGYFVRSYELKQDSKGKSSKVAK